MFNAEKPSLEELPSSARLLRSTVIAALGAVVILGTAVLPAEYGIDPTGAGRVLGLTEMGEIKQELADQAEQDRALHGPDQSSSLLDDFLGLLGGTAQAEKVWRNEVTFTLAPGDTAEIKLVMVEGNTAEYGWTAEGGRINFDLHAHGDGRSIDYDRGRGASAGDGSIEAPFAGEHGWFWRDRDRADVTVTRQLRGDYSELKQTD